ncbi:MAG: hypothetical protein NVSMB49_10530 [Ktedonobacteraceae bacterium]
MSQQAFEPQQNERPFHTHYDNTVQENIQESEARPYYWSTRPNTGNIPKNEHPANFEDSIADMSLIPPYNYQAQDRPAQETTYATTPPLQAKQRSQQSQRQQFSPDGDAMEHGYRPYGSYSRQVPPWARPQGGNKAARLLLFVVLGFMLMKPLLWILGALLVFAGIAFAALLLLAGFVVISMLIVFAALGRPLPFGIFRSRRRPWGRWRGYV